MTHKKSREEEISIVWTTVDSQQTARRLATSLLGARLAACVQIDSPVESHYRWDGQVQVDAEYRLIIKSRSSLTSAVMDHLAQNHPYDEPQILVTPVTVASPGYARWVVDQTQ
ncbi:divalent-cation tolerance protein CutA [Allorhodopirellula heiligendammensis]|uniref:Divalent-cation tolerance protein CutA n=1 Tax=Allorhodopirellula heiligendammensis TaxID=2714739 RepID=A0A5C6C824_9BACT|nr:divalent-cation tolerance protein CutA [Allorhodopirellula heiligendammensis]TWU18909.1 Divalent-cation tolerance protein CutA [Allorhodopirellula heiligendammensis]